MPLPLPSFTEQLHAHLERGTLPESGYTKEQWGVQVWLALVVLSLNYLHTGRLGRVSHKMELAWTGAPANAAQRKALALLEEYVEKFCGAGVIEENAWGE